MTSRSSSFITRGRARRAAVLWAVFTIAAALAPPRAAHGADNWKRQGPAPAVDGQIENVAPDNEVVGAIHTVLAHPTDSRTLYVGTVNGGVWRTTNANALHPKWTQLTDGMPTSAIGALEFDFSDPLHNTLWAGVGRYSSFGRLGGNRVGLYRSVDGGNTWTLVNGGGVLNGKNISGVAARGNTIAISVDTADAFTFGNIGVWRSTNGGATFTQIATGNGAATGLPGGVTHDLVGDRANPSRLFTSVVFANLVGGLNGVYRSMDTGATWTKVSNAAMDALLISGVTNNVEFSVGSHNEVYAAISNSGRLAGLFRSGDGGATWAAMDRPMTGPNNVGIHPGAQGSIHMSILADPTDANLVYIGGDRQPNRQEEGLPATEPPSQFPNSIGARNFSGRLFRCDASLAAGSQCTPLTNVGTASNSSPHADSREMTFDAAGNLVQTDDGGIYKRTSPRDAAGDWFSLNGTLHVTEEHDLSYDTLSDIIFTGTQDNDDPHQSEPGNRVSFVLLSGDGGDTAVDTQSAGPGVSTRYDSAQGLAAFVRTFWDAGNNFLGFTFIPLMPIGGSPALIGQFTTPVELNGITPTRMVIGAANGVYESFDRGDTIQLITPPCTPPACPIVINGNGVDAVSYGGVSNADLLVVGSSDRLYLRTAAHPAPLTQVATYPGTGTGRTVRDIVIHPENANAIYLTNTTDVFQTLDGGASWTAVTGNLQSFAPIALRAIAYVARPGGEPNDLLVVSTFNGLYASREATGFTTWERFGTGLPNVPIFDLYYDAGDKVLVAGTLGRGSWKLKIGPND